VSDATTPHFHFTLPTIGGDQNTWGNALNGNWTSVDNLLNNIVGGETGIASGYLPLSGGTMTGPLQINSGLTVAGTTTLGSALIVNAPTTINGTLSASSTTINGGLSASSINAGSISTSGDITTGHNFAAGNDIFLNYPTITDFVIGASTATLRQIQWATNVSEVFDKSQSVFYWNMAGTKMSLDGSGDLTITGAGIKPGGGSWQASSDERVKRNVAPYTSGLDAVCKLLPIAFEYTGEGGTADDGKTYYGLSAQQAQGVMPELVVPMGGGYLGTQLGPLLLAVCNAIRELRDMIDA
jgi:hypothetical protein